MVKKSSNICYEHISVLDTKEYRKQALNVEETHFLDHLFDPDPSFDFVNFFYCIDT